MLMKYIWYYTQLHGEMCKALSAIYCKVLSIFPSLEAARPRSKSGIQALCSLHVALEKAKNILQHCSDCSKLYLVWIYFFIWLLIYLSPTTWSRLLAHGTGYCCWLIMLSSLPVFFFPFGGRIFIYGLYYDAGYNGGFCSSKIWKG